MTKLKKTKQMKRNPFYDEFETESQIIGFARPRKTRHGKKDRSKNIHNRERRW